MTGVAGAFVMFGGMVAFAFLISTLDYLAVRRDEKRARSESARR